MLTVSPALHNVHSVPAHVAPAPAREGSPVAALEQFATCYDVVYGFRHLLAFAREHHGDEQKARYIFALDLKLALRQAVMARPSEPLVDAAIAHMLAAANYLMLANRLASEWTPERIAELDTMEREADAAVDKILASEAAEELAQEAFPATSWADEVLEPGDLTADGVEWAYGLT